MIGNEETPFEERTCYDCKHLKAAVSWWCSNEEAIKARGTRIPGCYHCPYWEPDWKLIDPKMKTLENGYTPSFWGKLKNKFRFKELTPTNMK